MVGRKDEVIEEAGYIGGMFLDFSDLVIPPTFSPFSQLILNVDMMLGRDIKNPDADLSLNRQSRLYWLLWNQQKSNGTSYPDRGRGSSFSKLFIFNPLSHNPSGREQTLEIHIQIAQVPGVGP